MADTHMADKKSSRRPSAESMRGEVEVLHESFVDVNVDVDDDPKKNVQQPDRFGSFAKVDPKEIALVKKLDWHMMVCISIYNPHTIIEHELSR